MKTLMKITFAILAVFSSQLRAQGVETNYDKLVIGREYRVSIDLRTNKQLIAQNSNPKITFADTTYIVRTDENKVPETVEKKASETEKRKIYLSAGIGIGIPLLLNEITYNRVSPSGINFQLNITKLLQSGFAIRGDFQYSYYKTKNENAYSERGFIANRGANPNVVAGEAVYPEGHAFINSSFNFDFLFGGFRANKEVNPYAIAGGGLNILSSSNRGGVGYLFNLNLGGGLNYKYSDKMRFYAETEYSFPVMLGIRITPAGILYGTPSFRAGVQFEL